MPKRRALGVESNNDVTAGFVDLLMAFSKMVIDGIQAESTFEADEKSTIFVIEDYLGGRVEGWQFRIDSGARVKGLRSG